MDKCIISRKKIPTLRKSTNSVKKINDVANSRMTL